MNYWIAFVVGIILLVIAYTVPQLPPFVRTLLMVFGWILTILGGALMVFALLGSPVHIG